MKGCCLAFYLPWKGGKLGGNYEGLLLPDFFPFPDARQEGRLAPEDDAYVGNDVVLRMMLLFMSMMKQQAASKGAAGCKSCNSM